MGERVARRGLQVAPLGQAHVVETVGAGRGAQVASVSDQHRRKPGMPQRRRQVQALLRGAVDPVRDDRPGMAPAWDQPVRHRPQLVGNLHRREAQAESFPRIARVDVGFD